MRISDWSSDVCSSDLRILTTHTGSLPRPQDVVDLLLAEQVSPGSKKAELAAAAEKAIADVVGKQIEAGIDVINDGEQGRPDYTSHVKDRLTGNEDRKSTRQNSSH